MKFQVTAFKINEKARVVELVNSQRSLACLNFFSLDVHAVPDRGYQEHAFICPPIQHHINHIQFPMLHS